jgi:hypothetical protein
MKGKLRGDHAPLSFKYAVWGLLSGTGSILVLLTVALVTNNIVHHRQYPKHWL